jgi:hypothetical protein
LNTKSKIQKARCEYQKKDTKSKVWIRPFGKGKRDKDKDNTRKYKTRGQDKASEDKDKGQYTNIQDKKR